MSPKLRKELKEVNFSCASPASAAISTTIDRRSPMLMTAGSSGRAIDRYSPHLTDPLRSSPHLTDPLRSKTTLSPVLSQPPSKPKPYNPTKSRKTSEKKTDLISPANSSRYLLSTTHTTSEDFLDSEPVPSVVPNEPSRFQYAKGEDSTVIKPSSSARSEDHQVVVLRVSLHCKGCEGKVRKHISKMEGVTSFSTDLATKTVTVIGDVTPLGVLNSISKVKNAQLWPSPPLRQPPK